MKLKLAIVLQLSLISVFANAQKYNVLFIPVDDLKPLIRAWGDDFAITPNMDRLAKMGVNFTNNHCQQAVCGPTRASLLTGLRPDRTKVYDLKTNPRNTIPNMLSLPQYFKNNGYETAAFGKIFHGESASAGHDSLSWSIPYYKATTPAYAVSKVKVATESVDVSDETYNDGENTIKALELMEKLAKTNKPFFLAVGFRKPHLPFVAPKKYWDLYKGKTIPMPAITQHSVGAPEFAYTNFGELRQYEPMPKTGPIPIDQQRELILGYYACVSYMDAQLGKLLDGLTKHKLAQKTIVVLWGDHGWHLGDHGQWSKHTNYEQATRSPLIIYAPKYKGNAFVKSPTEFTDVFPTISELAGLPIPENLDGKSLVPLFKNPRAKVHDFAISQYGRGENGGMTGYALRNDRYRLVVWLKDKFKTSSKYQDGMIVAKELYDYQVDPLERKNHADETSYATVVDELTKQLIVFFDEQYFKIKNLNN